MKSFEIQLYRGGVWKTDSIYDDRALAEMEARRMEDSPRYSNLRIIEEVYDEKYETTKVRTIYRDKSFMEKVAKKSESSRMLESNKKHQKSRKRNYQTRKQVKNKSSFNVTKIAIQLSLIALLGVAGMVALQFLSEMK